MADPAAILDNAIRAQNIPLISMVIPDPANRAGWYAIHPAGTPQTQQDQAKTIIATTAVDAPAIADATATATAATPQIKALVVLQLWGRLGVQPTAAQIQTEAQRYIALVKQFS